jgi:hypothetical protein
MRGSVIAGCEAFPPRPEFLVESQLRAFKSELSPEILRPKDGLQDDSPKQGLISNAVKAKGFHRFKKLVHTS